MQSFASKCKCLPANTNILLVNANYVNWTQNIWRWTQNFLGKCEIFASEQSLLGEHKKEELFWKITQTFAGKLCVFAFSGRTQIICMLKQSFLGWSKYIHVYFFLPFHIISIIIVAKQRASEHGFSRESTDFLFIFL